MADSKTDSVHAEVVYALPGDTTVIPVDVSPGTTVDEAIQASGILQLIPDINLIAQRVGVFNQIVSLQQTVNEGDRIEIYRSLVTDPKESRRKRAARGNKD